MSSAPAICDFFLFVQSILMCDRLRHIQTGKNWRYNDGKMPSNSVLVFTVRLCGRSVCQNMCCKSKLKFYGNNTWIVLSAVSNTHILVNVILSADWQFCEAHIWLMTQVRSKTEIIDLTWQVAALCCCLKIIFWYLDNFDPGLQTFNSLSTLFKSLVLAYVIRFSV